MVSLQVPVVEVVLAGNDVLGDFPSLAVGVYYSDSQPLTSFKAAGKIMEINLLFTAQLGVPR